MSTVTGFAHGFTTSGVLKWCSAVLSCGHHGEVRLKPRRGACWTCGKVADLSDKATVCECGSTSWRQIWFPDHHNEADYVTQRGEEIPCQRCAAEAESLEQLRALDASTIHHGRFRTWCGQGHYYLYRLDPTSPSMFMLALSVPAIPAIEDLLRQKRICCLSPTEPA